MFVRPDDVDLFSPACHSYDWPPLSQSNAEYSTFLFTSLHFTSIRIKSNYNYNSRHLCLSFLFFSKLLPRVVSLLCCPLFSHHIRFSFFLLSFQQDASSCLNWIESSSSAELVCKLIAPKLAYVSANDQNLFDFSVAVHNPISPAFDAATNEPNLVSCLTSYVAHTKVDFWSRFSKCWLG